jgi:ADP-dependent NAD(P)H-hydrate dehydratase / NAD(P)H-hydrate epimerase
LIPILSSAQARAFDRFLSERCAVPSLLLMENAGRGAAWAVHERLAAPQRVLCVCGVGNNGGDGLVVARHLLGLGHTPSVLLLQRADALSGDARVNLEAWRGLGGTLIELDADTGARARLDELTAQSDAIVDAVFGTGLSREVGGRFRAAVESINAARRPGRAVFALDVPSGLQSDTGATLGVAVRADVTLTFGHPKTGLLTSLGADAAGELVLVDLGVPRERGPALEPRAHWLECDDAASWLEARTPSAHKGRSGRVLIVAGSPGKTGAALLSSSAALRSGAGLVTICTFAEAARSLDQRVVEVMTEALDPERPLAALEKALEGAAAVVVGPGLGLSAPARAVIDQIVLRWPGPKLVDADAVTAFAGRGQELRDAAGQCLLTPHPGELGRLLGVTAALVESDRFGALEQALALTGQAILLKGPHTLVGEPGSTPLVVSEGHPVLATGGAGDVLSGICGALLVGLPRLRAGALAALLHGHAARLWVAAHGGAERGLLARELADYVPQALARLRAQYAAHPGHTVRPA